MALTENQITAQNFKDFYNQIRPYLNGSFPTPIVNKFSKGDLYSTDERIIGQWIDGKPVYQKTVTGTITDTPSQGTSVATEVDLSSLNISSIVRMDGFYVTNTDPAWIFMLNGRIMDHSGADALVTVQMTYGDTNHKLVIRNSMLGANGATFYATLQYTKTTDYAINIGDGNDYSTEEQVVGTWIDGRPVYQRVVSMTMPDATTKYAITNIPDMDDIFLIFAYEKSSNSVISMDPAYGPDKKLHGYVWFTNANHADGARVILEAHDNDWAGVPVTICFQYTKTTD